MSCNIIGCKNRGQTKIAQGGASHFLLPQDPEIRMKWEIAMGKKKGEYSRSANICSDHFEDGCFRYSNKRRHLVQGAIPTLKLNLQENIKQSNIKKNIKEKKQVKSKIQEETKKCYEQPENYLMIVGDQEPSSPSAVSWLNYDTNEKSFENAKEKEADGRALKVQNALRNILIELNVITSDDPNINRSKKLKSDIVAIVFYYLGDAGTCNDYEVEEEDLEVKENIPDVDEMYSIPIEFEPNEFNYNTEFVPNLKYNSEIRLQTSDQNCEENVHSHDSSSKNLTYVKIINKMCNISESEPQLVNVNVKNAEEKILKTVVRHTCSDCGLSLSSAYLLSKHFPSCAGRYSNDSRLNYWDTNECPKCNKKVTKRSHLKHHLLRHKLRDYNAALENGLLDDPVFVPTENMNSDNENSTANMSGKTPRDRDQTGLKKNEIDNVVFSTIFDSSKPDHDFNVTFIVKKITLNSKLSEEGEVNSDIICEFCDEVFDSVDGLNEHKKGEHPGGGRPFVCNHCPRSYPKYHVLNAHMKVRHKDVTAADGQNKYLEKDMRALKYFPTSINIDVFECSYCKKMFSSPVELELHENGHLGIRKMKNDSNENVNSEPSEQDTDNKSEYICELCGIKCNSYWQLHKHKLSSHATDSTVQCSECKSNFKSLGGLKIHMHVMHSETLVCDLCGAVYNSLPAFRRHIIDHSAENNIKCDLCPKTFLTRRGLKIHLVAHSTIKTPRVIPATKTKTRIKVVRHTCANCGLSLSSAYLLSKHPPSCAGRYRDDSSLSYWGRMECPKCDKKFPTSACLEKHLIVHKLRDYNTALENGLLNDPVFVPTEDMNSDNEDSTAKTSSDRDPTGLKENRVANAAFSTIFDSSKPDCDFNVTFIVDKVTSNSKLCEEGEVTSDIICEFCDEAFDSVDGLNEHQQDEHPDGGRPFVCNHCSRSYSKYCMLIGHMKECHENVTAADGQNKYLEKDMRMSKYFPSSINLDVFECFHCKKMFVSPTDLENHQNIHLGIRKMTDDSNEIVNNEPSERDTVSKSEYICAICGKKNYSYRQHQKHNLFKHGKHSSVACPICKKNYRHINSLKLHIHNMHSQNSVCHLCGAVYNAIGSFKNHMLTHSDVKIKCDFCLKTFTNKSNLGKHLLTHTKERRWVCQICDKRFLERRTMTAHINAHLGLKPYKCLKCGNAFSSIKLRGAHMRLTKCRFKSIVEEND